MDACLKIDEVKALVAGELSAADEARFDAHVTSCSRCRKVVGTFARDRELALGNQQACEKIAVPGSDRSTFVLGSDKKPSIADSIEGYEILNEIHRGGQGVVYKATQKATKRTVALKVLLEGPYASPRQRHRFEREVDLVASLQHPNIVTVFESGVTGNELHYFAMEYVHGQPLDTYMKQSSLTVDETLRLFQKICMAVNYAHQKGVIHRDLKPDNILIDGEGEPRVLDFGLAKAAGPGMQNGAPVTVTGDFMGTLAYASPEQTKGDPHLIDIRTDVYSLGVVLYEMLTGEFPYDVVGQMAEVLHNIAEAEPRRPSTIRRRVNDEVETIVLKALSKERDRRYQSAETLARDIGHFLNGYPIDAKRDSALYVLRKQLKRYKVPVVIAVAFMVLVTGSAIGFWLLWGRADEQRQLADQRYEEVIRLADVKRLADANAAADDLWPAHPENIQAMKTWLEERAAPLRDNLPKHKATLASLRDKALAYDSEQQKHDRQTHPKAAELAEEKQRLAELQKELDDARAEDGDGPEEKAEQIETIEKVTAETEQNISELQATVNHRRTWRFSDDQTEWQHDTLAGLVENLKAFVDPDPKEGTLAAVEERLAFAESIEERSVTGPEAAAKWAHAIADIARIEVYRGMQLSPQLGLLPLHRDPRSGLWEFWHIQTGTKPEAGHASDEGDAKAANPWILTGDTGLVFVLVPGGTFWMGAQKEDPGGHNYDPQAGSDEIPVREITLSPFFISKYEMTQGQWLRFTGSNPSRYGVDFTWMGDPPAESPLHENQPSNPVEEVSWRDCRQVLDRLGLQFPTEAQWEYAARAGTESAWWTGNDMKSIGVERAGNLADGWTKRKGGPPTWHYDDWLEDGWVVHAPVGSFSPNGFGLHDTIGNLWEWCRDGWGGYDLDMESGHGLRLEANASRRVHRGGGYSNMATLCRSAYRNHLTPELRYHYLGVRPARAITE